MRANRYHSRKVSNPETFMVDDFNNPRVPTPLALKLLGTPPEPEIRHMAKSTGVSQALKQAAPRIVMSRG